MSLGQIKDYTPNFNLIIPRFDIATWHDYMESNFRSIDALFFNMFGINQYRGEWQNSTTYQIGDVLFIGDPNSQYTGRLVKVLVAHTTTANDSFDVYYAHNPINYDMFMDAAAAEQAAKLAKDWAIKTDGKVQGIDYSSKYYANLITPISSDIQNLSAISTDITNVSSISSNIVSVDNNSTNINTVASMKPDVDDVVAIKTDIEWIADNDFIVTNVSNNSNKITTVANNINSVNTNATNIADINTNASNISSINITVANISDINTTALNINDINTTANISNDISTVANIASDVISVVNNATDISAVAANNTNISAVANNETNINAVNANKNNIDAVAGNETNINAVSNNSSNINAVNANKTNIDTVASNSSNINTVSTNISDVNTAATNITAIQNASTYATNAANSANLAEDWATKMDGLVDNTDYSAKYYADQARQAATGAVVDNISISRNTDDELQTIGVINQNNTTTAIKTWTGTLAQYDALNGLYKFNPIDYIGDSSVYLKENRPKVGDFVYDANRNLLGTVNLADTSQGDYYIKSEAFRGRYRIYSSEYALNSLIDSNTLYNITDDNTAVVYQAYTKSEIDSLIEAIYPVGSIYIGTQSTCPLATLISGSTWVKVSEGRVLQGSDSGHIAGSTIAAGLPNITGSVSSKYYITDDGTTSGVFKSISGTGNYGTTQSNVGYGFTLDASRSSSIYGNSNTVQPPAYVVNIWERTV